MSCNSEAFIILDGAVKFVHCAKILFMWSILEDCSACGDIRVQ